MNSTRPWKIILTLAAIVLVSFAVGFLIGAETKQVEMRRRFDPEHWNVYAMKTLQRKLDLTAEQQTRIQTIIGQTVDEMKTVHLETIQRTTKIVDRLLGAISRELTPEQREIADALSPSAEEVSIDLLKVGPEKE